MKYISYIRYGLILISLVLVLFFTTYTTGAENVNAIIWWAQFLVYGAVVVLLGTSAYSASQNPKSAYSSLIGLLSLVVLLAVSYAMSDTSAVVTATKEFTNPRDLIIASTGLTATYIISALAILAIACTEIYNLIRK